MNKLILVVEFDDSLTPEDKEYLQEEASRALEKVNFKPDSIKWVKEED